MEEADCCASLATVKNEPEKMALIPNGDMDFACAYEFTGGSNESKPAEVEDE